MPENLGFLTVIDQTPAGLTGGFLILNRVGRPLEFYCTVPLLPEKIQQILYGDTLLPFLYGERIAQTLLQRSKLPILTIFTNVAMVLSAQTSTVHPVIYVFDCLTKSRIDDVSNSIPMHEISEELSESFQIPRVSGFDIENWRPVCVGNRLIAVPDTKNTTREELVSQIKVMARTIDLLEPFARIRHALDEARNTA